MKGKWAQGLRPRAFIWVIKDRIAASERPGGYARNHRKVRRDEELIWLRQQGFTHVLSLLDSPHNLSAYQEAGIPAAHVPLGRPGWEGEHLAQVFELLKTWYADPDELVLVHHEEFGDRLCGVIGGFLLSAGLIKGEAMAVAVTERLTGRQLGPAGRDIVHSTIVQGLAPDTPPPPPEPEPARPSKARSKSASKSRSRSASKPSVAVKARGKKSPKASSKRAPKAPAPIAKSPAKRAKAAPAKRAKAPAKRAKPAPAKRAKPAPAKGARSDGSRPTRPRSSGGSKAKPRSTPR